MLSSFCVQTVWPEKQERVDLSPFDRNPNFEAASAVHRVELGAVALEDRRVGGLMPGFRQPFAPDRRERAPDRGDVLALAEHRVSVGRHPQRGELLGHGGEVAHFNAGEVVEIYFFVGIVAGPVGGLPDLLRYVAEVRLQPFPLRGNARAGLSVVARDETREQERLDRFEPWRREFRHWG